MALAASIARLSGAFPLAGAYHARAAWRGRIVRETAQPADLLPCSERHLQCVWYDSTFRPAALRSAEGEEITVESPGRWNLCEGPDFLDAVLRIGRPRRRVQGDVEVHVRPADWQEHGHGRDPRYAGVVAHVTYLPGHLPAGTLPPGAVQIPLQDALSRGGTFSFEMVDVTAYPFAAFPEHLPPCGQTVAAWDPGRQGELLNEAGQARLQGKAERMAAAISRLGGEQVLYEEILCALGFKHNRVPCRQLARRVPVQELREAARGDALHAYAILLGVAGLLPARPAPRWDDETRAVVRSLWDMWWKRRSRWEDRLMPPGAWRVAGVRPPNHPVRRLAAAAMLFGGRDRLAETFAATDPSEPAAWFDEARALLNRNPGMDYWRRRLSFGGRPTQADSALIGPPRMAAILSNVVIPYLAASGIPVRSLLDRLPPEEDNAAIRQTAAALFGRDHNPVLYRQGLKQQGLLQIFHDFCLTNRSGCRRCILAASLNA